MFEKASKLKLRFDTPQGQLTTEDLWDLNLTSKASNRANLDDIAKSLYRSLKDTENEISFVTPVEKKGDELQTKFDIVKHIIAIKIAERDAEAKKVANRAERQKILALLDQKQNDKLSSSSEEELRALLDNLKD